MTSEIRHAFAHPLERAVATSGGVPRDRISVRDHIVEVEIGAFQQERGLTQRVCFNIVVEVQDPAEHGPVEDDVDRILSYDRVTEAIAHELAAERLNLLETLADRIALRILTEPMAQRIFVRIEKLDRGPGALGVEIVRSRRQLGDRLDTLEDEAAPQPQMLFLNNAAVLHPDLVAWIDQHVTHTSAPMVICVGLPDGPRPVADHAMAQRRIDLLAMEQTAWVLAARDPRDIVGGQAERIALYRALALRVVGGLVRD
ncbi:MAG: dihydroneopterin aldolase, partial [Primorskyibacter sp.]